MSVLDAGIGGYFTALGQAFDGLDRIFEVEGPWVQRHNLINHVLNEHLRRLRRTMSSLELHAGYADRFRIDTDDSGFPAYQHVLQLEEDEKAAAVRLAELDTADKIRESMLDAMLLEKTVPAKLQREMAERRYYETVQDKVHFLKLNRPRTIRMAYNKQSGRPFYVLHWSIYDGIANLAMIYMAVIEDSSPAGRDAWENLPELKRPSWHRPMDGLPNTEIGRSFDRFISGHSAYSLNLTSIGTALDTDFAKLHPKQLRRFIVGPFYAGGVTHHNEQLQQVLDGVANPENNWMLTWTMQELFSREEKPGRWGLFGSSAASEIFHIDTTDLDAVQQGVSRFERNALIPHEAYQAAYAQGRAADMLADYQCYIVSGDDVLKNV